MTLGSVKLITKTKTHLVESISDGEELSYMCESDRTKVRVLLIDI